MAIDDELKEEEHEKTRTSSIKLVISGGEVFLLGTNFVAVTQRQGLFTAL